MAKPSQIILLVEDSRHKQFIFRYLRRLGFGERAVRIRMSTSGRGSAEQWVREQFAIEVSACRRRQAQTKLIVLIDADTYTVQQRIRQFDQALQDAGHLLIDNGTDEVARLVPKRNIETWIFCLNDVPVEEHTDYKNRRNDWNDTIAAAAATLHLWSRPNAVVPPSCVESLQIGIRELQRLGI
jgi:hypothetical protein